jgi:hypothetical protein
MVSPFQIVRTQCKNGWGFPFRASFKRAYPALLEFLIEQLLLHSSARALSPFKISLKGHFFMRNGIKGCDGEFWISFKIDTFTKITKDATGMS